MGVEATLSTFRVQGQLAHRLKARKKSGEICHFLWDRKGNIFFGPPAGEIFILYSFTINFQAAFFWAEGNCHVLLLGKKSFQKKKAVAEVASRNFSLSRDISFHISPLSLFFFSFSFLLWEFQVYKEEKIEKKVVRCSSDRERERERENGYEGEKFSAKL